MFFLHFCILWNDPFSCIYCFMNFLFHLLFYNSLYPNFCHLLSLTFCGLRGSARCFSPILVWVVSCSGSSSGSGFICKEVIILRGEDRNTACINLENTRKREDIEWERRLHLRNIAAMNWWWSLGILSQLRNLEETLSPFFHVCR